MREFAADGPILAEARTGSFEHPETLELSGGTVEVVDISPEEEKTPVPTVFAPGWTATPEVFRC